MFSRGIITTIQRASVSQITGAFKALSVAPATFATNVKASASLANSSAIQKTDVVKDVNNLLKNDNLGRLFAVVQVCGKQFKVTAGDIVIIEGYWAPQNGDNIRLDKVLLAGGEDFTVIGRPILDPGLIDVQATIIEKCLSHTKTHFRKKRRKQYMRINFNRSQHTMVRINSIDFIGEINEAQKPENPKIF